MSSERIPIGAIVYGRSGAQCRVIESHPDRLIIDCDAVNRVVKPESIVRWETAHTLTVELLRLLVSDAADRTEAIAAWATTPQVQREAIVKQCSPEVIQALKQTVLYG